MHLLVTGATGLLGNNIVRALLARGDRVRALVRKTSDLKALEGLEVELVEGDVCDSASVVKACEGIDAVIHSAAYVHFGWSQMEQHRAINVEGTANVARAAREAGIRMVHVSSVSALGIGSWENLGHEEMGTEGGIDAPYTLTKREAEQVMLREVAAGLDGVIVNPTFMIGPWDWRPSSGKLLLEMATRWVPFVPAGGNNFVDVRDVAAGILLALEKGQAGRRYILGGENMTFKDVFHKFAQLNGRSGPTVPFGPFNRWISGLFNDMWGKLTGVEPELNSASIASSMLPHYFTSRRAEEELGYTHRSLDDACRDAWEWFKSHGYVK